MNISATLNVFRLLYNPKLCMPHMTISNFNQLPIPIESKTHHIKAVVLDKDNCFAYPYDDKVWPAYSNTWNRLREAYPDAALLIVSNSAGTNDDKNHKEADLLEQRTGVPVLRHSTKKPGCKDEILQYFYDKKVISQPQEVAVVGDRLFTDILMSNMMGSYGIWVRDGVKPSSSLISKFEKQLYEYLKPDN